jgi:predicted component of type VI protein secretion system
MKLVRVLVAALVGLLALAGCSTSPRVAAVVNGVEVPVSAVEQLQPALAPFLSDSSAQSVAGMLVAVELGRQLAANHQLTFTDDDRAALKAQLPAELVALPETADFVAGYVDLNLVASSLGDAFTTEAAAIPVQVNPRFGTWDPDQFSLTGSGSLSSPAPEQP